MKKTINSFISIVLFSVVAGAISSCTPMDDYLKYTNGKEIVYTGQVDIAVFRSGRERVVFYGLLMSDPKVNKVCIFWDNKKDSVVLNFERNPLGIDTLEANIPLPEGTYNFEIFTYDKEGHESVPAHAMGNSYGENYESGLYDRPIKGIAQMADHVLIDWYNSDPTSFVQLDFQDSQNVWHTRIVPASSDTTVLLDCKPVSQINMQTYYIPDALAVDTFKVKKPKYINADADYTAKYIKNPGGGTNGILGVELSDGYGYPLEWTVNEAVKVNDSKQGWSKANKALYFESIAGRNIENGKVYQTFTLPKGKYTVEYNCLRGSPLTVNTAKTDVYFVAAKGTDLPDFNTIEPANPGILSFYHIEAGNIIAGRHQITFTLTEETELTLGFVMTLKDDKSSYQVNELKLSYDAVF